jgi:hypothetical protein
LLNRHPALICADLLADGDSFNEAYGKILGTAAVCAVIPILISFLPHRAIQKVRRDRHARFALVGQPGWPPSPAEPWPAPPLSW